MPEQNPQVRDLTPLEVAQGLQDGRFILVDVREPNETAVERFPEAVLVSLSSFDPAAIPDPAGRDVVFACRSGRRSVTASLAAQEQGFPYGSQNYYLILLYSCAVAQIRCSRPSPAHPDDDAHRQILMSSSSCPDAPRSRTAGRPAAPTM